MNQKRINASAVRTMCAGITDMTLWRWLNDPKLGFPKPIYIGRRRYWKEVEIISWLDIQETEAPQILKPSRIGNLS